MKYLFLIHYELICITIKSYKVKIFIIKQEAKS